MTKLLKSTTYYTTPKTNIVHQFVNNLIKPQMFYKAFPSLIVVLEIEMSSNSTST